MRERLDCAILEFDDLEDWYEQKEGIYARGRLHLHRVRLAATGADVRALAEMASQLQRFDVCLLAVCQENVAWVRQAMLRAQPQLRTPVIGLVHELKAPAIGDLYNLGMADFVRGPLCIEEIRIRTERLLDHPRSIPDSAYTNIAAAGLCTVNDERKDYGSYDIGALGMLCSAPGDILGVASDPDVVRQAGDIALDAFALASASQCAVSCESFGVAKGRIVACFERAYIRASLAKSSGNIALAARGAKKHRRAYWALMRKHNIDAAPYRKVMPPNQ